METVLIVLGIILVLVLANFYSRVKLKGKGRDIDVWGKRRGVPFGKSICKAKFF